MGTGPLSTRVIPSKLELVKSLAPAIASALLPGLGQAGQRRWVEGGLFLALALWLRLVLASYGWILTPDKDALGAALWGVFALPDAGSVPLAVVVTGLLVLVHSWAAWDAREAV
jgi:hypothetical protein